MDALVQYTGQRLANRYLPFLMRTRSGLQYRQQRGGTRQWSGPNLARRTMAQRRSFARSATMTRNRHRTSGLGITTQHDERRIYKKRSMPAFKRRRWKRFKNKVLAVAEKDLGTRTVVFNRTDTWSNTTANNQIFANYCLYGFQSTQAQCNDMNNITALEIGTWTAASGGVVDATSKFIFKSGIIDLTFRNTSTFTAVATPALDSAAKLETDIYELLSSAPFDDSSATYNDMGAVFSQGDTDTLRIGGAGTSLAINFRGCTPCDRDWETVP